MGTTVTTNLTLRWPLLVEDMRIILHKGTSIPGYYLLDPLNRGTGYGNGDTESAYSGDGGLKTKADHFVRSGDGDGQGVFDVPSH